MRIEEFVSHLIGGYLRARSLGYLVDEDMGDRREAPVSGPCSSSASRAAATLRPRTYQSPKRRGINATKMGLISAVGVITASISTPLPAIAQAEPYYQFQSPSGNIDCGMGVFHNTGYALCEIGIHTWVAPPRPPVCEGGWGDRIGMNQGSAATLSCHTDTLRGSGLPTLAFGDKWSANSITCDSEPSGITCTDLSTGHFFSIARDSYQLR